TRRGGARPRPGLSRSWGGYSRPGHTTLIPATAGAKSSCRLVPGQVPDEVAAKVVAAVEAAAPAGVVVEALPHGGGRAVLTPLDHPAVQAAVRAVASVFGREPLLLRGGGSIPPVESF